LRQAHRERHQGLVEILHGGFNYFACKILACKVNLFKQQAASSKQQASKNAGTHDGSCRPFWKGLELPEELARQREKTRRGSVCSRWTQIPRLVDLEAEDGRFSAAGARR
jgi:hypothetical protein